MNWRTRYISASGGWFSVAAVGCCTQSPNCAAARRDAMRWTELSWATTLRCVFCLVSSVGLWFLGFVTFLLCSLFANSRLLWTCVVCVQFQIRALVHTNASSVAYTRGVQKSKETNTNNNNNNNKNKNKEINFTFTREETQNTICRRDVVCGKYECGAQKVNKIGKTEVKKIKKKKTSNCKEKFLVKKLNWKN